MFSRWHRDRALTGASDRFGESAAVLLGDLCLVWAAKMLRESGIGADALVRVWPRYDDMRIELAIGQFADLVNDAHAFPTLDDVLDVLRRKSGNYTVRRPLEIGAAMSGCAPEVIDALGGYGAAIGEAFQLRDDLLGVFGSPTLTGKSVGTDLAAQKATSVVVAAHRLADTALRRQLSELMSTSQLSLADTERWRSLITASGAVQWIEQLIDERLARALGCLDSVEIPEIDPRRTRRHGSYMHRKGRLMRTVEGRTDRVVVVGAGLSGLSAALYLAGRGRNVTVVERGSRPRRPGRTGRHLRLPPGHRSDGADDARHHRRRLVRGWRNAERPPRPAAGAPGLPGDVRRRQHAGGAHRGGRDVR